MIAPDVGLGVVFGTCNANIQERAFPALQKDVILDSIQTFTANCANLR